MLESPGSSPPCPGFDLLCIGEKAIGSGFGTVSNNAAQDITNFLASQAVAAEKWAIGSAMSLFLNIPGPNLRCHHLSPCPGGPIEFLQRDTIWFAGFAGVLGLLIAAIRLALERKASAGKYAVRGMLNITFTFAAGITVITLGEQAGNLYSKWIIGQAMGFDHGLTQAQQAQKLQTDIANLAIRLGVPGTSTTVQTTLVLVIIFVAFLGFVGGIAQIFLMLWRSAVLGLLAGLLPISAAASTTETGMAWFRKHVTWILAYLLYGPVAATILAFAYVSLRSPNATDEVTGGVLFVLSVLAMPALMRLAVPLVAQATVRGGSGGMVAATPVAAGLAGLGVRLGVGTPTGAVRALGTASLDRRSGRRPHGGGDS